jgi:DNA polymerase-3 subunit alpha
MEDIEALGLLKMDLLGLKTLSIIEETLSWIRKDSGTIQLDSIPTNDPVMLSIFGNQHKTYSDS